MSWPTTPDGQYWRFEGIILMPVDPSTGVAQLLLRPEGGMGVGIPAIVQGDDGVPPTILEEINFTPLPDGDPNPDSASWTQLAPNVYQLNLSLHGGEKGDDGSTSIDVDSVAGAPAAGKLPALNGDADGFEYVSQKVMDRRYPASINNTVSGTANSTLTVFSVLPGTYDFDWRPRVGGFTVVTGAGSNVRVDLVARLNGETGGNIVGSCVGIASTERLHLEGAPPSGSPDSWDRVPAGEGATIFVRTERRSGSDYYTTSADTSLFYMDVCAAR